MSSPYSEDELARLRKCNAAGAWIEWCDRDKAWFWKFPRKPRGGSGFKRSIDAADDFLAKREGREVEREG